MLFDPDFGVMATTRNACAKCAASSARRRMKGRFPVPILSVDQPPRLRRRGQDNRAGAAVRIVVRHTLLATGKLQDLGARVDQHDRSHADAGAGGNAFHLLDEVWCPIADARDEVADQPLDAFAGVAQAAELLFIVPERPADSLARLLSVHFAASPRRSVDLDQWKRCDRHAWP